MNILWITLESILPANTGGRIGVFKRLEQLAKTEKIYLFYPYDDESELVFAKELEKYCVKVYPFSRKANKIHGLKQLWKYPFTVGSREFASMRKAICDCIVEKSINIINVDFPHMCVNLLGLQLTVPVVLNEHNIEWEVYRTIAMSHKNPIKKVAYFLDSYRLKAYEQEIFRKLNFSRVTFVSTRDMQHMIGMYMVHKNKATLIPVGGDLHEIEPVSHFSPNIIFVGKMSYGPNIEAVKWFVNEMFPKITREINHAKFYIVGKDPTDEVKALQSENIIVTGMVENVENYYRIADLVVLPLKNGGGVKVKLLEAISYDLPVVSTSTGVEGTYYADHLIPIADNAQDFADICKNILLGKFKYPSAEIFNYYLENYTWVNIGAKYQKCLKKAVDESLSEI